MSNVEDLDLTIPNISIRKVEHHRVPTDTPQVCVSSIVGGSHYAVHPPEGGWAQHLLFQDGDPSEEGLNGISVEALLAVIIDKIECDIVHDTGEGVDVVLAKYAGALERVQKTLTDLRRNEVYYGM